MVVSQDDYSQCVNLIFQEREEWRWEISLSGCSPRSPQGLRLLFQGLLTLQEGDKHKRRSPGA